jgi:peroxin-6
MNTAALVAMDLFDLMNRAKSASIERTLETMSYVNSAQIMVFRDQSTFSFSHRSPHHSPFDLISAGVSVTDADLTLAMESARVSYSDTIGAPRIPNVTWDDVGGLASVKADILDTIQLPLERPELFADGLKKRSGEILWI